MILQIWYHTWWFGKIKQKINLIKAIKTVIIILNQNPHLIEEYSNLPYFGQECIEYWHDFPESYPFSVKLPFDYIPKSKLNDNNFTNIKTTAAGSIIQ